MTLRASAQFPGIDRPTLRKLLHAVLLSDSDLEAFCLDYFAEVQRRWSGGMDRDAKLNLLLLREESSAILAALRMAHPSAVERELPALLIPAALGLVSQKASNTMPPGPAPPVQAPPTKREWRWDFFIAYAGADTEPAVQLHEQLRQYGHRPYVAKKCLLPGDDWNVELPRAQRQAQMTVVLVSSRCGHAYYQREEIAAAISLVRAESYSHRVVPVYLEGRPADIAEVPYGLASKHGLNAVELGGLAGIAQALDELLRTLREREAPQ